MKHLPQGQMFHGRHLKLLNNFYDYIFAVKINKWPQ